MKRERKRSRKCLVRSKIEMHAETSRMMSQGFRLRPTNQTEDRRRVPLNSSQPASVRIRLRDSVRLLTPSLLHSITTSRSNYFQRNSIRVQFSADDFTVC